MNIESYGKINSFKIFGTYIMNLLNLKEENMKPDELYNLLPEGTFYLSDTINKIRQYNPSQRFPTSKYPLYEVLNAWYALVMSRSVETDGYEAKKIK